MIPSSLRARVTVIGVITAALVLGLGAWVTVRALSSQLRGDLDRQNAEVLDTLANAIADGADPQRLFIPIGAGGTDFAIEDTDGAILNSSFLPFTGEGTEFLAGGAVTESAFGTVGPDGLVVAEIPINFDTGLTVTTPDGSIIQFEGDIPAELVEALASGQLTEVDLVGAAQVAMPQNAEELAASSLDELPDEIIEELLNPIPLDELDAGDWFETTRTAVAPSGQELTLVAFSPLGVIGRSVDRLAVAMAIIVPLLVLVGGFALWFALGAALDPVRRISDEARRIAPSNSGDRLPVPESGDEIAALTVTLNDMLDRLDAGLIRQRQFVSDASHELRSPLTAARGMAELLKDRSDLPDDVDGNIKALGRSTRRLEVILDDLTDLAASGISGDTHEFDLTDVVLDEVEQVAGTTPNISFSTSGIEAMVAVGRAVPIGRAVHNLLTNAARYASTQVAVATAVTETGRTQIIVDDDGPGVPEGDRDRIFDRFVRLSEDRSRVTGGSGLGLSLVASIAEDHGGSIACTDSPLGGARFVIEF